MLARLIDDRPDFDPRAGLAQLPPMDLYGALLIQVTGQQLSVPATRRTLARIQALFGGYLPAPAERLAVDPGQLRQAGLSWRKVSTLRDLAERITDGRLNPDVLSTLGVHQHARGPNFGGDPVDERRHHLGVGRVGHLAPDTVGEFPQSAFVPVDRHHRQAPDRKGFRHRLTKRPACTGHDRHLRAHAISLESLGHSLSGRANRPRRTPGLPPAR
jgi:hypothetical protein